MKFGTSLLTVALLAVSCGDSEKVAPPPEAIGDPVPAVPAPEEPKEPQQPKAVRKSAVEVRTEECVNTVKGLLPSLDAAVTAARGAIDRLMDAARSEVGSRETDHGAVAEALKKAQADAKTAGDAHAEAMKRQREAESALLDVKLTPLSPGARLAAVVKAYLGAQDGTSSTAVAVRDTAALIEGIQQELDTLTAEQERLAGEIAAATDEKKRADLDTELAAVNTKLADATARLEASRKRLADLRAVQNDPQAAVKAARDGARGIADADLPESHRLLKTALGKVLDLAENPGTEIAALQEAEYNHDMAKFAEADAQDEARATAKAATEASKEYRQARSRYESAREAAGATKDTPAVRNEVARLKSEMDRAKSVSTTADVARDSAKKNLSDAKKRRAEMKKTLDAAEKKAAEKIALITRTTTEFAAVAVVPLAQLAEEQGAVKEKVDVAIAAESAARAAAGEAAGRVEAAGAAVDRAQLAADAARSEAESAKLLVNPQDAERLKARATAVGTAAHDLADNALSPASVAAFRESVRNLEVSLREMPDAGDVHSLVAPQNAVRVAVQAVITAAGQFNGPIQELDVARAMAAAGRRRS